MSVRIDYGKLNNIATNINSRNRDCKDAGYANYGILQAVGNFIERVSSIKEAEIAMVASSLNRWARTKNWINRNVLKPGDIVMVDLGLNYSPELAYEHPAIVLEEFSNMIMIVPTTSNTNDIANAYHPISNPNGNWYNRKVDATDGFSKECAIVLNNLKIVAKSRAHCVGRLTCSLTDPNGLFREIRTTLIKNCFSREYVIYNGLKMDKEAADKEIEKKNKRIQELEEELRLLTDVEYVKNNKKTVIKVDDLNEKETDEMAE
ncbi:MAG: type II toxin-antitoxin system PemK/MazF family toxin [Pseudobutyrivibrio ruminis]|uniref:Type II toxin-antitoxin system PemK/MazF family toxin n=1 Tax=Pseudobutyrivibrio ruminis TaxID=46206 RepID=A0A927UEB1_9FIRM|nr:type II toxin-antitoxin system PemK/MazF family toxin [Pseudobutyrivibrio ruminis]